jgi:hypothetical protein
LQLASSLALQQRPQSQLVPQLQWRRQWQLVLLQLQTPWVLWSAL